MTQPISQWTTVPAIAAKIHSMRWITLGVRVGQTPIILVAGLGCSSRYWTRLGPRLARSYEVLAPDAPGFGKSKRSKKLRWPGGPNVREQADQLLAWMDARGIQRAILCGHSVGCQTVADVAARFPQRVEKLILAAPTFEAGHRTLRSHVPRLLLGALVEAPSLTPLLIKEYLSANLLRVLQQAVRTMADPIENSLPKISADTLVIRGRLDPLVRQNWTDRVTRLLPRGQQVIIEEVGHGVQYSSPAVMAATIDDFLRGQPIHSPKDDPKHDPLGPPQPISPATHGVIDYAVAAASILLPWWVQPPPDVRRVLTFSGVVSTANNLLTRARCWPMITHANVDFITGASLLVAAANRKRSTAGRCTAAALGAYHIAMGLLTAKPTGPAIKHPVKREPASLPFRPA